MSFVQRSALHSDRRRLVAIKQCEERIRQANEAIKHARKNPEGDERNKVVAALWQNKLEKAEKDLANTKKNIGSGSSHRTRTESPGTI